jgi:hypothetical protein
VLEYAPTIDDEALKTKISRNRTELFPENIVVSATVTYCILDLLSSRVLYAQEIFDEVSEAMITLSWDMDLAVMMELLDATSGIISEIIAMENVLEEVRSFLNLTLQLYFT